MRNFTVIASVSACYNKTPLWQTNTTVTAEKSFKVETNRQPSVTTSNLEVISYMSLITDNEPLCPNDDECISGCIAPKTLSSPGIEL